MAEQACHPELYPDLYDAIKARGFLYFLTFRELKSRYGEAEAIGIMRSVSRAQGVAAGRAMAHCAPRDFEALAACWVMAPGKGAIFQPEVRKLDATGIEVKMMACPIKDAWVEAGCDDQEICTLLHCASAYDQAALETAGFHCDLRLWSPGQDGCCLTKIKERPQAARPVKK